MLKENILQLLSCYSLSKFLKEIAEKVIYGERITLEEGELLFKEGDLPYLGMLANYIRETKHGDTTYYNQNFHIEPTNICVFDCKFCSYSRLVKNCDEGWEMSFDEIIEKVKMYTHQDVTEVHIVGGVHPKMDLHFFVKLIKNIKDILPDIHVKAFTAIELEYMCRKAKVSFREGLQLLKEAGQNSLPGGGAEIFDEDIRSKICADKCSSEQWLKIHEIAHQLGMPSNATILYGHIETYQHRIEHLNRLRDLQDKTNGFNAFIPLKFRNKDNQLSHIKEVSVIEDLRNYAVSRIFLDNFSHIKSYWPMIGRETAQLSLSFGVNDLDGTIDDTTKIYTLAGAEEQKPSMTTEEIKLLIKEVGRKPIERDSLYNIITKSQVPQCPV